MQTLHFRNTGIFYSTYGSPESPAVMLLHGYLESMDIWIETAGELQDEFFIITPDLPGHGLSGVYSEIHTMEDMAEAVKMILD
jgi:pimeloyl-ACP methyl ester carboxylesterase